MEIEVRNLGIIESAHLEFVPGLNLIVGSSSSGKSTLLRGIRCMMDNSFSDSHITYGKQKMAFRIQSNGHTATYVRDLENAHRKSAYQVDGQIYTKIGRGSLDALSDLFKLSPIEIDGEKISFNFSAQFSGPFLLLGSPSLLYSILTYRSSFDITKINDLYFTDLKKVRQDINVLIKSKESIEKERISKQIQLDTIADAPEIYASVQKIKNSFSDLSVMKDVYVKYKECLEKYNKSINLLYNINNALNSFNGYFDKSRSVNLLNSYLADSHRLFSVLHNIANINYASSGVSSYIGNYTKYKLLSQYKEAECNARFSEKTLHYITPIIDGISVFKVSLELFNTLRCYVKVHDSIKYIAGMLKNIDPSIKAIDRYSVLYKETDVLYTYISRAKSVSNIKARLSSINIPSCNSIDVLYGYLNMRVKKEEAENKIFGINKSLSEVCSRIDDIGVCPLCGNVLNHAH